MYLTDRPRPDAAERPRATAGAGSRRVGGTVVLLGLVSLFTDISSEAVSAVLPLYLTAVLGLSPLAYGFIDGLYQGVGALVRILGGWLADRADRPKWVAVLGYGLSALTKIVLIVAQSLAAITTIITVDRLGKGLRTAPRDALIAASAPASSLGRAFGVHRALDTAGAAIGPLLAFVVLWLLPGDYRAVFVASLAAALLGLTLLVLLVPDLRPRRAGLGGSAAGPPAPPRLRLLVERRFGRLMLATAALAVLTISDGFLYLSLQQRDDFAAAWFPLLYVGTNICYFALAVPFGRLSDRFGRVPVMITGHLFLIGAYLCAATPLGGLTATLGCLLLLGAFYAATDGVLAALASTMVPIAVRASGIATAQTVVALARFLSSMGFGLLWVWLGRGAAVYAVALSLACVVPVAWWLLRGVERSAKPAGSDDRLPEPAGSDSEPAS